MPVLRPTDTLKMRTPRTLSHLTATLRSRGLSTSAASRQQTQTSRSPTEKDRRTCRSEEHTSELQSLMRNSYAVFCLNKKTKPERNINRTHNRTRITNQTIYV